MFKTTNKKFAIPLNTNGINNIDILFNNKCNNNTFDYKNFRLQQKNPITNLLYVDDITHETQQLYTTYLNNITKQNINLYNSVYEDINILGYQINN